MLPIIANRKGVLTPHFFFFYVFLGTIRPTIANKNKTSSLFCFFLCLWAQLCGEALISPFLFCAYLCNSARELCSPPSRTKGELQLYYIHCLLLQLMVVLFLSFVTNEIVENEPKFIFVLFVFLLDANSKENNEC